VSIKRNKKRFLRSSGAFCKVGMGGEGKGNEARDWRTHDRGG
jgi:hypothetical protein